MVLNHVSVRPGMIQVYHDIHGSHHDKKSLRVVSIPSAPKTLVEILEDV